jgi:hypothetical protein
LAARNNIGALHRSNTGGKHPLKEHTPFELIVSLPYPACDGLYARALEKGRQHDVNVQNAKRCGTVKGLWALVARRVRDNLIWVAVSAHDDRTCSGLHPRCT